VQDTSSENTDVLLCEILKLMKKRLKFMPLVAEWKLRNHKSLYDPTREKFLTEQLTNELSTEQQALVFLRGFFSCQFQAAKLLQKQYSFSRPLKEEASLPDLERELRPRIAETTKAMLPVLQSLRRSAIHAANSGFVMASLIRLEYHLDEFGPEVKNIALQQLRSDHWYQAGD